MGEGITEGKTEGLGDEVGMGEEVGAGTEGTAVGAHPTHNKRILNDTF